jgi:hypothetical protein
LAIKTIKNDTYQEEHKLTTLREKMKQRRQISTPKFNSTQQIFTTLIITRQIKFSLTLLANQLLTIKVQVGHGRQINLPSKFQMVKICLRQTWNLRLIIFVDNLII